MTIKRIIFQTSVDNERSFKFIIESVDTKNR